MKKLFMMMSLLMMTLCFAPTTMAEEITLDIIRSAMGEMNEELPTEIDDDVYMILVELDDKTETLDFYFYTASEDLTIDTLREYENTLSEVMLDAIVRTDDEDQKAIVRCLKKNGYGVTMTFVDDNEETVCFVFLADEL